LPTPELLTDPVDDVELGVETPNVDFVEVPGPMRTTGLVVTELVVTEFVGTEVVATEVVATEVVGVSVDELVDPQSPAIVEISDAKVAFTDCSQDTHA
jgi:hypothetical protein